MQIEIHTQSDVGTQGNVRKRTNADDFLVLNLANKKNVCGNGEASVSNSLKFNLTAPVVLSVANGAGAGGDGLFASQLMTKQVLKNFSEPEYKTSDKSENDFSLLRNLLSAVVDADAELLGIYKKGNDFSGTSDFTGAIIDRQRLSIVHLGSSRIYLFRRGEFYQITKDHSFTQLLIDQGTLTEEDARTNIIDARRLWFILGADDHFSTASQALTLELENRDILLLCTNGIFNDAYSPTDFRLNAPDITTIIEKNKENLGEARRLLIEAVNEKGGFIDKTIILAKIYASDLPKSANTAEPKIISVDLKSLMPEIYDVYD